MVRSISPGNTGLAIALTHVVYNKPYFRRMLSLAAVHINASLEASYLFSDTQLHDGHVVDSYINFNELLWNYEFIFYEN